MPSLDRAAIEAGHWTEPLTQIPRLHHSCCPQKGPLRCSVRPECWHSRVHTLALQQTAPRRILNRRLKVYCAMKVRTVAVVRVEYRHGHERCQ